MPSGKVHFDGTAFVRHLSDITKAVQKKTPEALRALAEEVRDGAVARAPIKSGELRESIRVEMQPSGRVADIVVGPVYGKGGYNYAIAMHEGHPKVIGGLYELGELSQAYSDGPAHYGKGIGVKFLERAFNAVYRSAMKRLAGDYADAIRSATRGR
ncbi:HK97 gp10 family phage protein [Azospirillum sp. Sh1]|uniref:HK97 gp10 family phage protein n=1 Tax=Azospirillum sp. Sh1 TaxID=2607285 RepID=UPI0011ECD2C5|nr:HK97 gp10 family phage protein [Azospirillum sp. Sh1]KAA0573362.1 HK97 gp10 family phage protein [Azospirillum sp. Sh1]